MSTVSCLKSVYTKFCTPSDVIWCWKRGITCPDTVDQFLDMAFQDKVPAPETITVKADAKYWRVIDATINHNKSEVAA